MLLQFKMKNYKSFREEMDLRMIPAQKIKDLEYSLLTKKVGDKDVKALSSAVIYGPNSSGKTNIIGGMDVFRSIILNGNIKNKESITTPNIAAIKLELIPNIKSNDKEPVSFYIKFVVEKMLVEMKLVIELGNFLNREYDRKIIEEELKINDTLIYKRGSKLEIGKIEIIKEHLIENFSKDTAIKIAESNLDKQELFFNGMFKMLYSKKIFDIITKWYETKFRIICHADKLHFSPKIPSEDGKKLWVDKTLNKAVKDFGLSSENIAYPITEKDERVEPMSIVSTKDNKKAVIPAEFFESFGTIRFLNIFPMLIRTIRSGATLVIDELDASIHPMAIMNIINIFHNDEININGAQLIFNTHNPIFLNNALLRRDEIKFVEKDENGSVHYSLSDFGTSGKNGVRNTEDYMKNYFINKYGAIKDIDFSEIFKKK